MIVGLQVYVKNSPEAVEVYKKAFNAELAPNPAFNDDGTYMHAELRVNGKPILYLSEFTEPYTEIVKQYHNISHQTMQFCVNLKTEEAIWRAYEVLSVGGIVSFSPAPTEWCPMLCELVDKFGVYWGFNI